MTPISDLSSLAQLSALAQTLPTIDSAARTAAENRQAILTKPLGALGDLEEIALFMAGWRSSPTPEINHAQAIVFAGNHGICAQGVNPFPQEVTAQMVANFQAGGAAINQLCKATGADLDVIALDLDTPTADFSTGPAMSEGEVMDAIKQGAAAVPDNADILILGEMGIGNSTTSAALACGAFGSTGQDWVGPGTGSDAAGRALKAFVVDKGVALHSGVKGLNLLVAFGGREQAAICGAVIAARLKRIPVLLDGYICTAAVASLFDDSPVWLDHCLVAHLSREPGHAKLLAAMHKTPILTLNMALGEGSGAALALGIVRAALACHNGMATFEQAGVANAETDDV